MIKRMQSNGAGGKPKVYSGAIDCLRQILQKEGVGGATLFAPLEMSNEGDLFPGVTFENKKDPAGFRKKRPALRIIHFGVAVA